MKSIFLPGCPILLESAGPGPYRDGEPFSRQPSHQGSTPIPSISSFSSDQVSQNWFPVSERLLATGVLAMSLPLGIVCGQGISPQFVVILLYLVAILR